MFCGMGLFSYFCNRNRLAPKRANEDRAFRWILSQPQNFGKSIARDDGQTNAHVLVCCHLAYIILGVSGCSLFCKGNPKARG